MEMIGAAEIQFCLSLLSNYFMLIDQKLGEKQIELKVFSLFSQSQNNKTEMSEILVWKYTCN